jgi:PII-like signaling protein
MLPVGPAIKVTIYLNRDTGDAANFLHDDILEFLRSKGVQGSSAIRADAGFGSHRQLHTSGEGDVAGMHLLIVICFIARQEKIDEILPELLPLVSDGLVEAHPTEILKNVSSAAQLIS